MHDLVTTLSDWLVRLRGQSPVALRRIRPDDQPRLVEAFAALGPQSIYQRFFMAKTALTQRELQLLTTVGNGRSEVLVATVGHGIGERIVGLGQSFARDSSAEVAFIVAEAYQGRGIATRMLRQLVHAAQVRGLDQLHAFVLPANLAMRNVMRKAGLPWQETEVDGLVRVNLNLRGQLLRPRSVPALRPTTDASESRRLPAAITATCGAKNDGSASVHPASMP